MDLLLPEQTPSSSGRRKVLIEASLGVGDITVLTGAVRELFRAYPRQFAVDVRTSSPELWFYNPLLTTLSDRDPQVERVTCRLDELGSSAAPESLRYIELFLRDLERQLGVPVSPHRLCGDIHVSANERLAPGPVQQLIGAKVPYWIVGTGGRLDVTVKQWSRARYQQVVDHFQGRILFAQVGLAAHHHPPLDGVLDLRGQTSLRELIRLVYACQGVLCGVTSLMHLAAAVPPCEQELAPICQRPCVVISGGREPALLTHYPDHQVIHNAGILPCSNGGCWRSRTHPLNDGSDLDLPEHRCTQVAGDLPRCMDHISADEVIRRIEGYFRGGATEYLQGYQVEAARRCQASRDRRAWRMPAPELTPPAVVPTPGHILLLTGADDRMGDLLAVSADRLRTYALRHGYRCQSIRFQTGEHRSGYWGKIPAIAQCLRQPDTDWVLWTDADTYITHLDQRLESLMRPDVNLHIGYDAYGINCGVMLIRSCGWSRRFFDAVQFLGTVGHQDDRVGDCQEQTTIRHILKTFPEHQSHVRAEEQHVLNSYLESWRPGDFILHLAGIHDDARVRILRRLHAGQSLETPIYDLRADGRSYGPDPQPGEIAEDDRGLTGTLGNQIPGADEDIQHGPGHGLPQIP